MEKYRSYDPVTMKAKSSILCSGFTASLHMTIHTGEKSNVSTAVMIRVPSALQI